MGMAAHESPPTKLYDRTRERLTQDEVGGSGCEFRNTGTVPLGLKLDRNGVQQVRDLFISIFLLAAFSTSTAIHAGGQNSIPAHNLVTSYFTDGLEALKSMLESSEGLPRVIGNVQHLNSRLIAEAKLRRLLVALTQTEAASLNVLHSPT
jgi:hypothetical protein